MRGQIEAECELLFKKRGLISSKSVDVGIGRHKGEET